MDEDGTYRTEIASKSKRLGFMLQTLSYSRILLGLGAAVSYNDYMFNRTETFMQILLHSDSHTCASNLVYQENLKEP